MKQVSDSKKDQDDITIKRWKGSRFWAIWLNQELLAVVCYKKGAMAIKKALLRQKQL